MCAILLLSPAAATSPWLSGDRYPSGEGNASLVGSEVAPAAAAGVGEPRRRVAVCFFGLTRSLRWVLPSLQRRLLGVLEEAGMTVDVFVHTYSLEKVRAWDLR